MNKENEVLFARTLNMVNGLLAITYVAGITWFGVQIFNMIF